MPTYEFRCPSGHSFERFYRKIADAVREVECPECGQIAVRQLSGGAGLVFKGSGFYLTDYGRNAHRTAGGATNSADKADSGESKSESKSESTSGESKGGESKSETAASSGAAESKRGESKSDAKGSDKSSGDRGGGDKGSAAKSESPNSAPPKKSDSSGGSAS